MISIIITAKDEARTVSQAVAAFLDQDFSREQKEIIVVAPDRETLAAAKIKPEIITIMDNGQGKSAALNLTIAKARGERLIFSDGDVVVAEGAVKSLLAREEAVVSGRPIVKAGREDKFGFWQKVLFEEADRMRRENFKAGKYFLVSGYLMMIKRSAWGEWRLPVECLAEDEYLSYYFGQKGEKIGYAPEAKVKVKGPENFGDWVRQKIRTLGASYQVPKEWKKGMAGRSFGQEAKEAWRMWLVYGDSCQHKRWLILLFLARLYVWILAIYKVVLCRQKREQIWQRVGSTK
ncbi:glycosyltransferase [Candidatus Kuenenbacteria bacterium]|nr:glycosyltransferase [Candidatus Kuenenbacteria bacterium]